MINNVVEKHVKSNQSDFSKEMLFMRIPEENMLIMEA